MAKIRPLPPVAFEGPEMVKSQADLVSGPARVRSDSQLRSLLAGAAADRQGGRECRPNPTVLHAKTGGQAMEPMDLLADTRRYLAAAIKQLEAINAGAPIAKPVTREQAVNIVTEQIGLFESVLRRYGGRKNV